MLAERITESSGFLTAAGMAALVVLALSLFVSYRLQKRNKISGCMAGFFTTCLVSMVFAICLTLTVFLVSIFDLMIRGQDYTAEVISIRTYIEEQRDSDDQQRNVQYFVPMLRFVDESGAVRQLESATHHRNEPQLNASVEIIYAAHHGRPIEKSTGAFVGVAIGLMFWCLFSWGSWRILREALGVRICT